MGSLSPLASVSATRDVLAAHGLATKKSLGQNFLINDDILRKIIDLAEVSSDDAVLEVGPGSARSPSRFSSMRGSWFRSNAIPICPPCSRTRSIPGRIASSSSAKMRSR